MPGDEDDGTTSVPISETVNADGEPLDQLADEPEDVPEGDGDDAPGDDKPKRANW